MWTCTGRIYEASHNVVLLQMMRALSGMLQGVFHNREKPTPGRRCATSCSTSTGRSSRR